MIKITGIKSGTKITSILRMDTLEGQMIYSRIQPKKPAVERKGDIVKVCHFYEGMRECLGPKCFWVKIGSCQIHKRISKRGFFKMDSMACKAKVFGMRKRRKVAI